MKLCKLNLPSKAVIIGEKYKKALELSLERLGVFVLWLPNNPFVDPRLSGHVDLSAIYAGENCLVLAPYLKETAFPTELEIEYGFADIEQGKMYPNDAQLNVCYAGEYVICNPKTAYKDALCGKLIAVKQGYSRCSVCVVSDGAIITADRGIADAVGDKLDVLQIEPGHVVLDGYKNGFIGGAAFELDNKLFFSGTLDGHPDRDKILSFIEKHGVEAVFLTDKEVFDFGGAIVIPR